MDMNKKDIQDEPVIKSRGCGIILLLFFVSFWVIILSGIDLFSSWTIEQSLFDSSVGVPDLRWFIQLIYSLLVLIPITILYFVVKTPRIKMIFRLWMFASILAILTIPLKTLYLTAQNETAILQISVMGLLLAAILFFKPKPTNLLSQSSEKSKLFGLAAFLVFGFSVPWILWGAMGSVLDTLLEIVVGIVFALLVVNLVMPFYLEKTQHSGREVKIADFIFDGFVVAVFLLILTASLSHNGSHQMLVITVPISGWLITAFSLAGAGKKDHGKFASGLVAGFVIALPLVFFDMDELSLVIGSGPGEVLAWANKAAWFMFMSILMLSIVLMINFKVVNNLNLPKKWSLVLTLTSILGFVLVYFIWGQVGFFGDKVFIILKAQATLPNVPETATYLEKRQSVFQVLVKEASDSQKPIWSQLDRWKLKYTSYYLVNGLEVDGGNITKLVFSKNSLVDRILDSPQLRPLPQPPVLGVGETPNAPTTATWNIKMIHADQVQNELGINGSGILIGQTDSGVDGKHPALSGSYRGASSSDAYNWYDPWNNSTFPVDEQGHGTQTLGIMVGKSIGVAPGAQWIGCVNLARNLGNPARYLDCMQFMLAPFPQGGNSFTDGNPELGVMIINNSWGCPRVEGCDPQVYSSTMQALKLAGIFMSAAAGNTGYYGCSTITDPPAIYPDVFTAGSVDQNGQISDFSSLGPVLYNGTDIIKPDLLAPGGNVLSSYPGDTYSTASGTSFSAPHVSGVVALMWSANPKLIGNVDATMQILKTTTQPYNGTHVDCGDVGNISGTGILDAFAAVKAAQNFK